MVLVLFVISAIFDLFIFDRTLPNYLSFSRVSHICHLGCFSARSSENFFFVFRARAATNIWMRVHFHLFPSISSSVLCFEKCFDYIHVYLYLQMCQLHQRQYFSAPATVLLVFFIFLLSFPSTHKACLSTT